MQTKRFHYGWLILIFGWLIYGFGIAPGYYSWGQLLPFAMDDLGLNRARAGLVFGIFTFLYSSAAPLSGVLIQRFGVRSLMVLGGLVASSGFLVMSRAESLTGAILGFSILGGLGIGLGVLLPSQTLASNWFVRYRATAIAVLMTAGGIVGKVVPKFDAAMAEDAGWRQVWLVIAGCSLFVAFLSFLFVRNTPESIGLEPDCRFEPAPPGSAKTGIDPDWDPGKALRTKHFAVLIFCGAAFATPWGVAVAHGTLHLRDLGFSGTTAAQIMGWMILMSIVGRLTAIAGDWMPPQRALSLALVAEAIGTVGFLWSPSPTISLVSAALLGLGFGSAYVSVSATFGAFFGRRAFSVTAGTRMAFTGVINAAMPPFAGWAFDEFGTYVMPFVILFALTTLGASLAWVLKAPQDPGHAQ